MKSQRSNANSSNAKSRQRTKKLRLLGTSLFVGAVAGAGLLSCNEHVFEVIDPCSDAVEETNVEIDPLTKADILLVVDNSGSMCEEQINLAENFLLPGCRIDDLNNIPEELLNPGPDLLAELSQECGFIQILAAYENDFRVGVITTDVGDCDNRFNFADNGDCNTGEDLGNWGNRPQRGCLQAPPGTAKKFIEKGDENIDITFSETLRSIQTFGSAFERGLDAVQLFMTPNSDRAEGCESDYNDFIRDDAALVVIFLTDEDDCSHTISEDFPDEVASQKCDGSTETPEPVLSSPFSPVRYEWCYERRDELKPVADYASFLRGVKGPGRENEVRVAVIAGGMPVGVTETGSKIIEPRGCYIQGSGANAGAPADDCIEPWGGTRRSDGTCEENGDDENRCCLADSGNRYYQLADLMPEGNSFKDSICFASFRDTMVEIAKFAAKIDVIDLENEPPRPSAIEVEITREGAADAQSVPRIPDGDPTDGADGWQYTPPDGNLPPRVSFYGIWVPQPGDDVNVFQAAGAADPECVPSETN